MSPQEHYTDRVDSRTKKLDDPRARSPFTDAERAVIRKRRIAVLAAARADQEAFIAQGGHVMTDDEFQDFWDRRWDDEDFGIAVAAK